jgi:dihydrofolate synthase/folylpolyglutamate synthase
MTYDEALAVWYGRIDFERKSPRPDDLKLERMRAVLRLLGDPHRRFRIIHVAGTKGKGSTAAILASVLRSAGYRVGLFTSPHLSDVRERIQIDGEPMTRDEVAARVAELSAAIRPMERSGDPLKIPTFFEFGTALGFLHFDCHRVDVAVVEVGLGGRFDSTNVCDPAVSVITNISFDHMALLGDRLALIAREKGGIIKRGRPVVSTAEAPEARAVLERIAAERHAPLTALGRDFAYEYEPGTMDARTSDRVATGASFSGCRLPRLRVTTKTATWPWMELGLFGRHQSANAAGAVAVVEVLRRQGIGIDDAAVARGLANVRWPARLEVVGTNPLIVLDCAHNVASAQALIDTIDDSVGAVGKRRLVFAISNDKQISEMAQVLVPYFDYFHLTRYSDNPRCMPPEQLAKIFAQLKPSARISIHSSAADALEQARSESSEKELIVVSGSVFLAGELRPLLVG